MSRDRLIRELQSGVLAMPAGLLLATLYAIACWATRQVSLDQFFLPSGVRVAALLITPLRMWPYLLLGEYAYFAEMRLPMVPTLGLEWVLASSAYQFPVVAAIVFPHRSSVSGQTGNWLLTVAAGAALSVGIGNIVLMDALWKSPLPDDFTVMASRFVLGHYIAILTVAPLAMLWIRRREIDWFTWRKPPSAAAAAALLALGVASTLMPSDAYVHKTTALLLMVAPIIALTCIQGWWGAAVGMPLMYAFVRISTPVTGMPGSFDLDSFKVQLVTALSGTALLALGSRVTGYYHQYLLHARAGRQAIYNARASHSAGERELRSRVDSLRRIGEGLDTSLSETIDWLRGRGYHEAATKLLHASTVHSQKFREQASMVYPTTMEHVGLYLAIQVGGIVDVWEQTGRLATPRFSGDPCCLSLDLQLAAYRALTEAVSLFLENERGLLKIRARCGRIGTSRGIVITVASADARHRVSRSTSTMATGRLSGRAQAFGGSVQCRGNRVRMYFAESSAC